MTRPGWHRFATRAVHWGWKEFQRLGTVTSDSPQAAQFGSLGEGTIIGFPLSSLHGESSIHIGRDGLIAPWATLGAGYLTVPNNAPERALVIGDRCWIGIRSAIVAHESIVIGDDVWFGQDVFVTDANHGYADLDTPIGNQLGPHQSVSIGAGSWIGHGAVILPGAQIGKHVVVAAGAVVRGEVPDNCVVGGVPARILKHID